MGNPAAEGVEGTRKSLPRFSGRTCLIRMELGDVSKGPGPPGGSACKESACSGRDPGSIPESGRSAGGGTGCPLQGSGEFQGLCRAWGRKEAVATERRSLFKRPYLVEIRVYG